MKKSIAPSSTYFYEQIALDIKLKIDGGEFKVGDKLPNEYDLCEIYDTSRITVRRALKELVEQDYIVIKRGIGTFIKEDRRRIHMVNLHGFTDGLSVTDEHIQKEILSKEIIDSDDKLKSIFNKKQTFKVIKLKRLITDDERTLSIDYSYFPVDMYPGILDKMQDEVSTFQLLREEYGVHFAHTTKEIELIYPDLHLKNYFGDGLIGPLYNVKKVIFNEKGTPVHYSRYYLDPTNVKIIIDTDVD